MFVSLIWLFSFLDLPNPQPLIFFFHISVTSKLPCRVCYSSRHLVAFFHESLFLSILKPNQHISIIYKTVCAGCRYKASAERRLCLNDLLHHYIPSSGEASSRSWASQTLSRYLQAGQQPLQKICGSRTTWFSEDDVATGGSVSWLSAAPPSWVVGCERGCYPLLSSTPPPTIVPRLWALHACCLNSNHSHFPLLNKKLMCYYIRCSHPHYLIQIHCM